MINDRYNVILNIISEQKKEEIPISDFDKINYWIELADYDLKTAKVMYKSKRYLYLWFMCNQVIEKILKAYYVKTHEDIPFYSLLIFCTFFQNTEVRKLGFLYV